MGSGMGSLQAEQHLLPLGEASKDEKEYQGEDFTSSSVGHSKKNLGGEGQP